MVTLKKVTPRSTGGGMYPERCGALPIALTEEQALTLAAKRIVRSVGECWLVPWYSTTGRVASSTRRYSELQMQYSSQGVFTSYRPQGSVGCDCT